MIANMSLNSLINEYNKICGDEAPDDPKGAAIRYNSLRELSHVLERAQSLIGGEAVSNISLCEKIVTPDDLLRQAACEISKYDHRLP